MRLSLPDDASDADLATALKERRGRGLDDEGITTLNLGRSKFTDAGLEYLKGLTNLEFLYLNHTKVTDAGAASLKEALPNCWISH